MKKWPLKTRWNNRQTAIIYIHTHCHLKGDETVTSLPSESTSYQAVVNIDRKYKTIPSHPKSTFFLN
jgi:hypothetical protein